jgi:hypothetical protein
MEEEKQSFGWGGGYQKPELLILAEKIYACKEEKRELEWQLQDEEFHYKYIPQRQSRVKQQVFSRLLITIPLFFCVLCALLGVIYTAISISTVRSEETQDTMEGASQLQSSGVIMLFAVLFLVFGGYALIRFFIIPEVKQLKLLWDSRDTEKAMERAKRKGLDTFQKDQEESRLKIEYMKERIGKLDGEMEELKARQQQLLDAKKKAEDMLREKEILFDKPVSKQTGKFALKEDSMGTEDVALIYEYYQKEEIYQKEYLIQLDAKLQRIDREIVAVEEGFETAKKRLFFFLVVFILVALFQQIFTGILAVITSLLCIIGSLVAAFYLEYSCKKPILDYLIENESELTKEYAFCTGQVPVKYKKKELQEEKQKCEESILDLKQRREALQFS